MRDSIKTIADITPPELKEEAKLKGKEIGDCAIKAFAFTTDLTYSEVRDRFNKNSRLNRDAIYGVPLSTIMVVGRELGFKSLYREIYRDWTYHIEHGRGGEYTVRKFAEKFNKGTYILDCTDHIVAVVDGVILDSWDSGRKRVKSALKKIEEES